jgi:sec-independent protein translocase protein TatA
LLVLVVLLVFGPSQLPKLAKGVGQALREFKKASREIGDEIEKEDTSTQQGPPKPQG